MLESCCVHTARILRVAGLVVFALVGFVPMPACSLLYDLSPIQCESTPDCQSRGGEFAHSTCKMGVCVSPEPSSGGSSSGGSSGDDGEGGEGGAPPECTTNAECIQKAFESASLCRSGHCVRLTTGTDCPLVLGTGTNNENLKKGDPIVIGAYSYVDPISPLQSAPNLNYELAIDEFNARTAGGLPGGENGKLRPIVVVVCAGTGTPNLEVSATHLIETLQVPAVISSLYSQDLLRTFLGHAKSKDVFFLSPLGSDSTLEGAKDDDLLWQMLGSASDLAPILRPLSTKVEQHVRSLYQIEASEPIRVALLEANTPFLADLAEYAYASVPWNGISAKANETAGAFLRIRIDSELVVPNPDVSDALQKLQVFKPHVVLTLASGEAVGLLKNLEVTWPSGASPAFYIYSPDLFGRKDLAEFATTYAPGRSLGFNYAAATDTRIYDSYFSRLISSNAVDFPLEGTENFYDTTYFMLYALASAHETGELTGSRIAQGMRRLVSGERTFDVGPTSVASVLTYLGQDPLATFSLQGTMGPPDFHLDNGARRMDPSVYCIDSEGTYVQNVALYDSDSGEINGVPPCVEGFPE